MYDNKYLMDDDKNTCSSSIITFNWLYQIMYIPLNYF